MDSAQQQQLEERLALLLQIDAHMQLSASRQALMRIAKLELAHLWYHQQQQQLPGGVLEDSASPSRSGLSGAQGQREGRPEGQQSLLQEGGDAGGKAAQTADAAVAAPLAPSRAAATATAGSDSAARAPGAAMEEDDDIFAAADRRARARTQAQQQQQQPQVEQRQQQVQQLEAQSAASRDPLSTLPTDVQLRLRELQRRAEAYGQTRAASMPAVLRNVAEAFGQRVSYGRVAQEAGGVSSGDGTVSPSTAAHMALSVGSGTVHGLRRRQMANPADLQLLQQGDAAAATPSYWAEHPLLSYGDNVVALAVRQSAARRLDAAAGPDGKSSLAAAVASLSASLPRPGHAPGGPPRPAPATPVLALLLDYLQAKYMDVLHTWEVAARLRDATERAAQEAAQQRATVTVQAGELLPATLRDELAGSWAQASAGFQPEALAPLLQADSAGAAGATLVEAGMQRTAAQQALAAPLDWSRAAAMLASPVGSGATDAAATAAAARTAAAAGDLRSAVQHALAPILAAAAARHQALHASRGISGGAAGAAAMVSAASSGVGAPPASQPAASAPRSAAASVACFRETLVLDASSAFEDSSHDCRVTLEFDVDRLAASEPALGGAWGARFLERLLSPALGSEPTGRRRSAADGSMAGRARRGAAARAALMAKAYPVDVERRFCRRTRTASLTTGRYPSREANRKLLVETYAELIRAVARAANAGGA